MSATNLTLHRYPTHIVRKVRELAEQWTPRTEIRRRLHTHDRVVRGILGPADRREMFSPAQLQRKSQELIAHPPPRDPQTGRFLPR